MGLKVKANTDVLGLTSRPQLQNFAYTSESYRHAGRWLNLSLRDRSRVQDRKPLRTKKRCNGLGASLGAVVGTRAGQAQRNASIPPTTQRTSRPPVLDERCKREPAALHRSFLCKTFFFVQYAEPRLICQTAVVYCSGSSWQFLVLFWPLLWSSSFAASRSYARRLKYAKNNPNPNFIIINRHFHNSKRDPISLSAALASFQLSETISGPGPKI
ncbi:uncharacterized protein BDW70DRAFT_37509 [Aspergillus foveolatus]|uniref:uncharacterized protein n=1 Tax=Aspergillus foveolatus TaxID=210207 RepID=UPI003CCE0174